MFDHRWLFPFIGHMGIATSSGVIRDFAGPYYVSEDEMAFGHPTKYWQLKPGKAQMNSWDEAVHDASEEYKKRMVCFLILWKMLYMLVSWLTVDLFSEIVFCSCFSCIAHVYFCVSCHRLKIVHNLLAILLEIKINMYCLFV